MALPTTDDSSLQAAARAAGAPAPRWLGLAYGLAMVLLFGMYTPAAKLWLGGVPPLFCSGLLYLSAGATLWGLRLARRAAGFGTSADRALRRGDARTLSLGVLCGVSASGLLLVGLGHVSATVGALLGNLEGVFTVAIALLFGDSLGGLEAGGAAAILAGGIVLSFQSSGGPGTQWPGVAAIALSCLAWAVDNTTTQRLSQRDPLDLMAIKSLLAGTLSLVLSAIARDPLPQLPGVVATVAIGAFGWAGSMVCFALAMRHLGAARVGSLLALAPFVGAIVSVVALGERPSATIAVASVFMVLGATLLTRAQILHAASK